MFAPRYLLSFSWRCCERTRKLVQVVKYFSNDRDCREVLGDESFCGPNFATNLLINLSVPGQSCSFPPYCTPTGWLTMNPETQCLYHWKKAVCLSFRLSVRLSPPTACLTEHTYWLTYYGSRNTMSLSLKKSPEQNQEQISYMCLVELFLNVIDTSVLFNIMSESTH